MDLMTTQDSALTVEQSAFDKLYAAINKYRYAIQPAEKATEECGKVWTYDAAQQKAITELEKMQQVLRELRLQVVDAEAEVIVEIRRTLDASRARLEKKAA